jgi:hypothetical protein
MHKVALLEQFVESTMKNVNTLQYLFSDIPDGTDTFVMTANGPGWWGRDRRYQ